MYLNLVQLAESFGVAEKVVEDWIRNEGLPHTPDRGRLLFDRAQVSQWAIERGLATQAGFLAPEQVKLIANERLDLLLRHGGIWRDVSAADLFNVLERIVSVLPGVTPSVRKLIGQRMRAKGGLTMAPVGGGFALPHPASRIALGHDAGTVALILMREPLAQAEPHVDDEPVSRLIFFVAPSPRAHLDLLGRLSRLLARGPFRQRVIQGATDDELRQILASADAGSIGTNQPEVAP